MARYQMGAYARPAGTDMRIGTSLLKGQAGQYLMLIYGEPRFRNHADIAHGYDVDDADSAMEAFQY